LRDVDGIIILKIIIQTYLYCVDCIHEAKEGFQQGVLLMTLMNIPVPSILVYFQTFSATISLSNGILLEMLPLLLLLSSSSSISHHYKNIVNPTAVRPTIQTPTASLDREFHL
jgi:hypothetical protein